MKHRALPLSYGPTDLEPTGFEPATTTVTGCSSICIRHEKLRNKYLSSVPAGRSEPDTCSQCTPDCICASLRQDKKWNDIGTNAAGS